jgi:hypothetical protein
MKRILCILALLLVAAATGVPAFAQFKEEAFSQSYNDDPDSPKDSTDTMFSFKEFFGGIAHKNPLKPGTMAFGSAIMPGTGQMYNRDYWKLPIVYAGLIGGVAGGYYFKKQGNSKASTLCFAGAGLTYWAMGLDEVICYDADFPSAGKATLYSILVPGLGQIYNGETWKLPIYWGGLLGSFHFYYLNRTNYQRFRRIYREATNTETTYDGPISAETALYYRNVYRRYRDYSVLAIAGFYLLQVIDANVFAYMHDFNIADDLVMSVDPVVLPADNCYAFGGGGNAALGFRLGITF